VGGGGSPTGNSWWAAVTRKVSTRSRQLCGTLVMVQTLSDGPPASRAGLQAVAAASSSQRRLGLVREAAKWCDSGMCVDLGFFMGTPN
jgi:hypothetical protein